MLSTTHAQIIRRLAISVVGKPPQSAIRRLSHFSRRFITIGTFLLVVIITALTFASPSTRPSTHPTGGLNYRLEGNPETWDPAVRHRIQDAMDQAVKVYHEYNPSLKMTIPVAYSPATPTADANYHGHIRFGGQIGTRTALHEIAHILGVGTYPSWRKFVVDGKWTGPHAIAQLQKFDGPDAVLHADRQHFWPYGLNYDSEGTTHEQYRRNVLMVLAIRADLGIDSQAAKP